MLITSKTETGVVVHLSEYELMSNLTKCDRWSIEEYLGKELPITGLHSAIQMAEAVAWSRKSIIERLEQLKKEITALPIGQFASKKL